MKGVLLYPSLPYVSEIIWSKLINRNHNNPLASHFRINKTCELIARKYYCPTFCQDVEAYIKRCDVCLAVKIVRHKPHGDLQSSSVPTHHQKNPLIDLVIGRPISINWKEECYNVILVIIDRLTKMIHYTLVKTTIDVVDLVKIIIDIVIRQHEFPESIVSNKSLLYILKFWFLVCYLLGIEQMLFTIFHPQINDWTERRNSMIETYLYTFINQDRNNWVRILPIAEFAYSNAKNVSTSYTFFELNCGYHPRVFFKNETNSHLRFYSANELVKELKNLILIY